MSNFSTGTSFQEDDLLLMIKSKLKKEIEFKYKQSIDDLELAERTIFRSIPKEVLYMKASILKAENYDLLKIINDLNAKRGIREKKVTFLPADLTLIHAEIKEEMTAEKILKSQHKKKIPTDKKILLISSKKPETAEKNCTPHKLENTGPKGLRSKTPTGRKANENQSQNKPLWRI